MYKLVLKVVLKKELDRARRAKDLERVDLIGQALSDDDFLDMIAQGAGAEFEYDHAIKTSAFGDFLKSVFAYFVEHKEEILSLIQFLVSILMLSETESDEATG